MAQDAKRVVIDDSVVSKIAAKADVDPRSVIRHLAGLPVRGRAGARVERAAAEVLGSRQLRVGER